MRTEGVLPHLAKGPRRTENRFGELGVGAWRKIQVTSN